MCVIGSSSSRKWHCLGIYDWCSGHRLCILHCRRQCRYSAYRYVAQGRTSQVGICSLLADSLLEQQHPPCHPAGWCQPGRPPAEGRSSRWQVSKSCNACKHPCALHCLMSVAGQAAARAHLELAHYQPAGQHWGCAAWCSDGCTPGNDVAVCEHHFDGLCLLN
jgi:hypothetical protein